MSEMIERVARAMYQRDHEEAVRTFGDWAIGTWPAFDTARPPQRRKFLELARAAIAAMREPTEGMVDAALDTTDIFERRPRSVVTTSWRAMIDAALAEGDKP